MLSNAQIEALRWLIEQLDTHKIEHQFVGGLAAIAHGATRPLVDIDLYINYKTSQHFLDAIKEYTYWGPKHEKDDCWDITYLKMNYAGQKIEIGDSQHAFIFSKQLNQWIPQGIDYSLTVRKIVYDCTIDVMPAAQLIAYKSALNREVDQQDIQAISNVNVN